LSNGFEVFIAFLVLLKMAFVLSTIVYIPLSLIFWKRIDWREPVIIIAIYLIS
jgi:hypothetical protein